MSSGGNPAPSPPRPGSAGGATPKEFDISRPDTWEIWQGRLESFFRCYSITDGSAQRDWFLNCCGLDLFGLAVSLVHPRKVDQVPYTDLIAAITSHLVPKPTQMTRRVEFFKRRRLPAESATAFLAELRKLARWCEFNDLEEALLNQFVCGQENPKLLKKLCAKRDLKMEDAMAIATAAEGTDLEDRRRGQLPAPSRSGVHHESLDSDSDSGKEDVQQTRRHSGPRPGGASPQSHASEAAGLPCGSCGGNHPRRTCRFRGATCRRCNKPGHIARACRAKTGNEGSRSGRGGQTAYIDEDAAQRRFDLLQVRRLKANAPGYIKLEVEIEGRPCPMFLDTGSPVSIISAKTLQEICPYQQPLLRVPPFKLRDFQKNPIALKGVGTFRVQFKGFRRNLDLFITEGPYTSLLGMNWMGPLGIEITGVNKTSVAGPDLTGVCAEFSTVFDGSLGLYKGPPISLQLNPAVRPIKLKARRVPFALKPKIGAELDRLVV